MLVQGEHPALIDLVSGENLLLVPGYQQSVADVAMLVAFQLVLDWKHLQAIATALVVALSKLVSFVSDVTAAPAAVRHVAPIVDSEEGHKPDSEVR